MRKMNRFVLAIIMCVTLVFLTACIKQNSEKRPPKEKWVQIILQATVESIDLEASEVTLRGAEGSLVTLGVNPEANRLKEVSVGDLVNTEYFTYVMAEFRKPTKEEIEKPFIILANGGKAQDDMPPGASVGAIIRAVVTIERINLGAKQVTIKGPRGKYLTLPVKDQDLLEDLEIGETTILTYAQAFAMSLEKVKK